MFKTGIKKTFYGLSFNNLKMIKGRPPKSTDQIYMFVTSLYI